MSKYDTKALVYTRVDGGVSVVHMAPQMFDPQSCTRQLFHSKDIVFENDEAVLDYIIKKDIAPGVSCQVIDKSEIPQDRTYRNAWSISNNTLTHDMEKARQLHREILRAERQPLLDALDVEYQRADEVGDLAKKKEIAAKKQTLRDITQLPSIDAATTIEELKLIRVIGKDNIKMPEIERDMSERTQLT